MKKFAREEWVSLLLIVFGLSLAIAGILMLAGTITDPTK